MKKIISIVAMACMFATITDAQSLLPRWGSGPPQNDNTGTSINYSVITVATGTATAVSYQVPQTFETIVKVGTLQHALTDTLSVVYAFLGDQVTFIFSADNFSAGRVVTFGGTHMNNAGTLTVPQSGEATITFIFDGVQWAEKSRAILTN